MNVAETIFDLAHTQGGVCLTRHEGVLDDAQYEEIKKEIEGGLREHFFGADPYVPPRFYLPLAQQFWEQTPGYRRYQDRHRQISELMNFAQHIGRRWKTEKGKWTKRFTRLYRKITGEKFPDQLRWWLSKLGKQFRESCELHDKYELRFDVYMRWRPGEFGDGGSCFWGEERKSIRKMFQEKNVYPLMVYRVDEDGGATPESRSLVALYRDNQVVVFNAYSRYNRDLEGLAFLLAEALGAQAYPIRVRNLGKTSGFLHLNNDGDAYVVGSPPTGETIDLGIDTEPWEHR